VLPAGRRLRTHPSSPPLRSTPRGRHVLLLRVVGASRTGWLSCLRPATILPLHRRLLTLGVSPTSRRAAISMRRGFIRRLATDRGGVRTARTRRRHEPPDNLLPPRLQPRRKVRHLIRNSLVLALTGAPPVPIGFPSLQPNRLTLPTLLRKRRSILARPQLRRFVGRPNRPRSHPRSWRSRPRRTLRRPRRTLRWPRASRLRPRRSRPGHEPSSRSRQAKLPSRQPSSRRCRRSPSRQTFLLRRQASRPGCLACLAKSRLCPFVGRLSHLRSPTRPCRQNRLVRHRTNRLACQTCPERHRACRPPRHSARSGIVQTLPGNRDILFGCGHALIRLIHALGGHRDGFGKHLHTALGSMSRITGRLNVSSGDSVAIFEVRCRPSRVAPQRIRGDCLGRRRPPNAVGCRLRRLRRSGPLRRFALGSLGEVLCLAIKRFGGVSTLRLRREPFRRLTEAGRRFGAGCRLVADCGPLAEPLPSPVAGFGSSTRVFRSLVRPWVAPVELAPILALLKRGSPRRLVADRAVRRAAHR